MQCLINKMGNFVQYDTSRVIWAEKMVSGGFVFGLQEHHRGQVLRRLHFLSPLSPPSCSHVSPFNNGIEDSETCRNVTGSKCLLFCSLSLLTLLPRYFPPVFCQEGGIDFFLFLKKVFAVEWW